MRGVVAVSGVLAADGYRFGRHVLVPRERQLFADGKPVALEPRTFDLLTALVARGGGLATKEELLNTVWPDRVVEESNLHVHVSILRKLLGREFVQTVAGHGYRIAAAVSPLEPPLGESGGEPSRPPNNLPRPIAAFIGRAKALQALREMLPRTRLLSLTGIGGSGKTRLAIRLAEQSSGLFPDGIRFVDLAPLTDAARIATTVAAAAGVREQGDRDIVDTLLAHCAGRRLLFVFDNCEHVLDAAAALAGRLLHALPTLTLLVTSRERLGIEGETVVPVAPLDAPPPGQALARDALAQCEAVQLFVARAQQAAPAFALDDANAAAVAEICRRLDGIPLALELAAAHVPLLSAEQIRAALDDRFRLLTGSVRALPRHQTLRISLQSSYDDLESDAQLAFARLAVCTGGWSLATATAIVGIGDAIATTKLLERLVDTSLVRAGRSGGADEPRYGMLETVRAFADEQLRATAGAAAAARERHLDFFLDFARTAQSRLFGDDVRAWLDRIDAELPNLLAAHAWCDEAKDGAERGLELATNLRTYWLGRGLFADGQRVYDQALARPGFDRDGRAHGKVLYALGQHQYVRGRLADAIAPTERALAIARVHGDDELVVQCLDRIGLAYAWLGDLERAAACAEEELVVAERTQQPRLIGFALTARGGVLRGRGEFASALAAYERALALFDAGTDRHNRHNALIDVARASIASGTLPRARAALSAALELIAEMGTLYRGHFALEASSRLASAVEDWEAAARLQGASDAAVDAVGGTRTWFDDPVLQALCERPRAILGERGYAAAYELGRRLPLADALAEAGAWLADALPERTNARRA